MSLCSIIICIGWELNCHYDDANISLIFIWFTILYIPTILITVSSGSCFGLKITFLYTPNEVVSCRFTFDVMLPWQHSEETITVCFSYTIRGTPYATVAYSLLLLCKEVPHLLFDTYQNQGKAILANDELLQCKVYVVYMTLISLLMCWQ